MLDGVEPEVVEEIRHAACEVEGVEEVSEVRARWLGHRLQAEVNHRLMHHLSYLSGAVVHVDPIQEAGEEHHRIGSHSHNGLPTHSH